MQTLDAPAPAVSGEPSGRPPGHPSLAAAAVGSAPTLVTLALLFVALFYEGAYALRNWAPLAVFALVSLAVARGSGVGRAGATVAGAFAAFAAWSLISVAWSRAPGDGIQDAARECLYAALVALPILTLPSRLAAVRVAQALCAFAGAIVAVTVVMCLTDGSGHFLAGRLQDPVGYRNGTAALFALCFWPLACAAAQRRLHALLRAGAFALAVAALGLAFLTQSRGVVLGFAAGAVPALALGPDRLRRAWLALLAVGAIAAASRTLLAPYDAFVATLKTSPPAVSHALTGLLAVTAGAFVAALVLAVFDGGLRMSAGPQGRVRTAAAVVLALVTVGAVAVALAKTGDPVSYVSAKVREFKTVDVVAPSETRLGSTGGQRYDLWRIAWRDFQAHPLAGAGEASYPVRYYRERATDRNLATPHSLPLRVLGELGIVGLLLLGGAVVAAFVALAAGWRRATGTERRWASALAAAAIVLLGQSAVDWLWLIPGLTGLGLLCLATAVAIVALPQPGRAPAARRGRSLAWRIPAVAAVVLVAALFVSDAYVRKARAGDTATRLSAARTAHRLNPLDLTPRYLEASALEESGHAGQARATLRAALAAQPDSFVTLGLLGDLETRAGHRAAARGYYRRALALNPRDTGLQALAR
ncbi:MAG: hypothetical protein QOE28_324 [Solirubrobacteraceae bacterium]|nr:hypothetical protein [Solirubrobacteraceae bacterium]